MSKQIRIKAKDSIDEAILAIVSSTSVEDLPFNPPLEMRWPIGPREQSERAMVLLRAGYQALLEKYPGSEPDQVELSPKPVVNNEAEEAEEGWA